MYYIHFCGMCTRRLFDTTKRLSQSRVSHLVTSGALLLDYLVICGLISIHILSDYNCIWFVFASVTDTNIFKILDPKLKILMILMVHVQINQFGGRHKI